MPLDLTQLSALKTEVENDPTTMLDDLGLMPVTLTSNNHQAVADALNDPTNALGRGTITRREATADEVRRAVTHTDFEALTDVQRLFLVHVVLGGETVDGSAGTPTLAALSAYFRPTGPGSETDTWDNIIATVQRDASRAEVLFGEHTRLTGSDVAAALRLP